MPSQSSLLAQEQALESFGVGSIKKIFGRQREPYGFLTIHHPEELRGDEAVFYLKDVLVANFDYCSYQSERGFCEVLDPV